MSLPRYPEYKDSGVAWLGEVPAHWQTKRLRHVAGLNPSKNETVSLPRDTVVSFLPMEAIGEDGTITLEQTRLLSQVETGYTYFRNGDVAVAKITPCFENGKGAVMRGLLGGIGFGSTELIVSRPRPEHTNSNYLNWIFNSTQFRKLAEGAMYGAGGQKRVPDDFVRNFAMAFPPVAEQTAIATFLDRETAKIDRLIAEQEKLIDLLAEKRQATISHAVTKGLNPDAPMRDSGLEWLGAIPAHWTISRLGRFATVENGTTPSRLKEEYWAEGNVPWLASGEVNQLYINEASEFITAKALEECSLRVLPVGTIIVGMIGQGKTRGMSAMLCVPASINQNLAAICPGPQLTSKYLLNIFHAVYEWLREAGRGGNQAAMNCQILSALRIPLPSMDEQALIVAFIDAETARLDALTAEATRGIDLLKERRSALISATVTGKVDVRHLALAEAA